jgi:hypothetical protein
VKLAEDLQLKIERLKKLTTSPFAILGFIDYLGFLGEIGHPLLGERGPNDATG